MAENVSLRKVVVTCAVALIGCVFLSILLSRLLPDAGILTQAAPMGLAAGVMIPMIVRYINRPR